MEEATLGNQVIEALAIIIVIVVALRLFIAWTARRTDEIQDFYSDDENSAVVETLLHINQARGNHQ